jgi:O-antigen/teichoic acid export membrane protein
MISRGFFKSSLIYSIVGALPYASGFLLLPWFTALLTPKQFGINALYISLMYLIQILSSFGQDMAVSVQYFDHKDDRQRLRSYLGTVFAGIGFTGLITFLMFTFGGISLFNITFGSGDFIQLIPFGLFTILSGILNGSFKTYSTLLIAQQRPVRFFWLNISNFAFTIGASLTLIYMFPYTLFGPVLGRLIPAIMSASLSLFLLTREYGLHWNTAYIRKIVSYSTPLLVYALLTWMVNYIDRFIILRVMADPALVGIYDFAVKLVIGIELIMTGLINTINPKIYNIWKDQDLHESTIEVNRYYNGITALVLLVIPLFVILAPLLLPLVIKKVIYYEAFSFLAILAAGYATRPWFFMFLAPLMYFKNTKALPRVFLISAIFQVGAGLVLIHFFGLMGAVWTNFLVKPLQALLMFLASRKVFRFRVNQWKIFWLPVIFIALVLISESFATRETRMTIQAGQFLVTLILVLTVYRKEIAPVMKKLAVRFRR